MRTVLAPATARDVPAIRCYCCVTSALPLWLLTSRVSRRGVSQRRRQRCRRSRQKTYRRWSVRSAAHSASLLRVLSRVHYYSMSLSLANGSLCSMSTSCPSARTCPSNFDAVSLTDAAANDWRVCIVHFLLTVASSVATVSLSRSRLLILPMVRRNVREARVPKATLGDNGARLAGVSGRAARV